MRSIVTFFLITISSFSFCQNQIIRAPRFAARTTTRIHIDSIDCRNNLTRIYLTCLDQPNRSIVFSKKLYLQNAETGQQWQATDMDGADFDRRFVFPETGSVNINIDFPVLSPALASADLVQTDPDQSWRIVDIDLTGKRQPEQLLPEWLYGNWQNTEGEWQCGFYDRITTLGNQFWDYTDIRFLPDHLYIAVRNNKGETRQIKIRQHKDNTCSIAIGDAAFQTHTKNISPVPSKKRNTANTYTTFSSDSAIIKGVIDGYHPRLGFNSGILYLDNIITRQEEKIEIPIDSTGRFEKKIMLYYPVQQTLYFPSGYLNFYLEPGADLTIYTEMEQLATPSPTLEEVEKQLTHTRYMGSLATVNDELKKLRISKQFDSEQYMKDIQNMPVETFKKKQQEIYRNNIQKSNDYSPLCQQITRLNELYSYGRKMLDYEQFRRNRQLPFKPDNHYYDFLKELPLNDFRSLSASEYKLFIAYLEKSAPFQDYRPTAPELINAFAEKDIRLSEKEQELIAFSLQMQRYSDTLHISDYSRRMTQFNSQYKDTQADIREQLILKNKHRVWTETFGLSPSITFELLFSRQFIPRYQFMKRALTAQEFDAYTRYIRQPIVRQLVSQLNKGFSGQSNESSDKKNRL